MTDRRKFLGKSFGAVPLIMTTGSSYGGGGGKKSLWISGGKKKDGWGSGGGGGKKSGKSWQGKDWDKWDEPPRSGSSHDFSKSDQKYAGSSKNADWDFESPSKEWRTWRPEVNESQKPDWQWNQDARDVPVTHIEKTIRPKE